jgi:hypothetical protein
MGAEEAMDREVEMKVASRSWTFIQPLIISLITGYEWCYSTTISVNDAKMYTIKSECAL